MKFVKLATLDDSAIEKLAGVEGFGQTYYYDSEASREIIIVSKHIVNLFYGTELHDDFIDETDNVFVVVTEEAIYAIATKDVSLYFDQLIAKLEVAEMAETDKC